MRHAVGASGTVATPSHALHGTASATPIATSAVARPHPTARIAAYGAATLTTPSTYATTRATPSERPSTSIAVPVTQNGKGSQLVPLGSSVGWCANCCAMTTRA